MHKIRILATEDDALHEEMLRITIDKLGYELIDVVFRPGDLLLKLAATKPDLLLMDIDLGEEKSGIDLIKEVNERYDVPVIYVTSFADSDTFREAKKTHPSAYVVKPYQEAELQRAIELAISNRQEDSGNLRAFRNKSAQNDFIYIKQDNKLVKLEVKSILLIEAYDKYCFLYTAGKKHMIRTRLKDVLAQLPQSLFCQVHRSYIINIEAIEEIGLEDGKIHVAAKRISVSKTYKKNLYSRIKFVV